MAVYVVGGVEYVTSSEILERLAPDVGPDTLRGWYRPRPGAPAALLTPLTDPAGKPVRMRGELVFRWTDVVEAEWATRTSGRGRKRKPLAA